MDELWFFHKAQDSLNLTGRFSQNSARLLGGIVHEAACELFAIRGDTGHHIASVKIALGRCHAHWQERLATGNQHTCSPRIQNETSSQLEVIGQPLLTRGQNG
jgi:hypothetical protein